MINLTFADCRPVVLALFLIVSSPVWAQQQVPVFVSIAKEQPFVDEVEALGTLQANENVNLTSTVTERITEVNFTDNERVKKGQLLVQMEASQELAELAEQELRVREAERQYNRAKQLADSGVMTTNELDTRRLEFETASARINAIQSRIEERRLVAPFDGVVGIRNISVGALAQPGAVMVTIDDDRVMKLDFSVPEVFLASLRRGIEVEARASGYPDRLFKGTVTSVNSRVDATTRAVAARAILDNEQRLLKAGMLITLVLKKSPREAIVIPEEALVTIASNNSVFVVREKDGKQIAERVSVTLGARRTGEIEILEGLSGGEQIITHGINRVRPGSEVVVKAVETGEESLQELLMQNSDEQT